MQTLNWQELHDEVRVWIYQSDRKLSEKEIAEIRGHAFKFLSMWSAHGEHLSASFEVFHSRFLVFFVDESVTLATGCSIDKSVHFVQEIESQYGLELMNRLSIARKSSDDIITQHQSDLIEEIRAGAIHPETPIFNNSIQTKGDFLNQWEVPLNKSWLNRYIPV